MKLGKYRILTPLGREGTTQAYRAKVVGVEGFEKPVVLWRMQAETGRRVRWAAQASRAATLSHANITQVLDVVCLGGQSYVVTEYVSGVSLASLLTRGRSLPWPLATQLAIYVASALAYTHARRDSRERLLGIVHGSVSPHRILLSDAGDVKLTGFGTTLGRLERRSRYVSKYRSPEQIAGDPIDGRSDVYALALVLRESLPAERPAAIDAALAAALERYPEHRATAEVLRRDLSTICRERGARVTPRDMARWGCGAAMNQTAR